jgi:hypothetical protein
MMFPWFRNVTQRRMARAARLRVARPTVELLEDRSLPSASPVGDVFVILMENHNWTQPSSYTSSSGSIPQIQGSASAPYINNTLTQIGAYANNYENAGAGIHPSEPNYIWLEAGSNLGVTNDADPTNPANRFNAPSFTQQLDNAGISWKSYQEDIDLDSTGHLLPQSQWTVPLSSTSGTRSDGTQWNYAPKHNPDVFFDYNIGATAANGFTPNPNDPFGIAHNQPLQQFYQDLFTGNVGKFNYITPNQYNDMHSLRNGSTDLIAQGDNWLAQNIPIIMASQAYKNNGVIMVVWDETEGGDTSQFTVPFFVVSPLARAGHFNSTMYTHSSTLKTLEEIEGVSPFLGGAGNTGTNDLSDLFMPGVLTPSTLQGRAFIDLHGTGVFQNGDPAVSGATVFLTGTNEAGETVHLTTTTNANGTYSFTGLLPGTYDIRIAHVSGLRDDFTTPHGTRDDITLGVDQTLGGLDFGFVTEHHHHRGDQGEGNGQDH